MPIFEFSNEKYKNGRRPFKAVLYELQPPESVVDDVGTKFNENGITFLEEYCSDKLDSIKDMSVTVEFLDEDRTMISAHGQTGVKDGMPIFENATTIGHFTEGYIDDVEIDGLKKRCVLGNGYIDEMRYKSFVETLETEINNGNVISGSIEIYKSEGNKAIVYKKGWLPEGRIPTEFTHTGWAMVINPADASSALLELNSKNNKEENIKMDEKELKTLIQSTITEVNSKNDELVKTINELNSQIEEKNSKISELNATVEQVQKALDNLQKESETYWEQRKILAEELAELKVAARLNELNSAISVFSADEQKYAENEINSFKDNPLDGSVDAVVATIYAGIGRASKKALDDAKIAEQNAKSNNSGLDIFSEVNAAKDDNIDTNIF